MATHLPKTLTRKSLLEFLLGDTIRAPVDVGGFELVMPEGATPVWRRQLLRGTALPSWGTALRAFGPVVDMDVDGGVIQALRLGTTDIELLADPTDALSDEERAAGMSVIDLMPGEHPATPRLPGAKVSYVELYDLRLTFRLIDIGVPGTEPDPEWRSHLDGVLTSIRTYSNNADLIDRGRRDLLSGRRSPEAEFVLLHDALGAAPWSTLRPLKSGSRIGFGSVALPAAHAPGVSSGNARTAAAFVDACMSLLIEESVVMAAIAALEQPEKRLCDVPSLLTSREDALTYWRQRKSEWKKNARTRGSERAEPRPRRRKSPKSSV